jgi:lipid-A-disaccharide synthase
MGQGPVVKVFVIAGEPSGDKLGQAVMKGLRSLVPDVTFKGVGGPLMQAEGLTSLFPMDELSVMGLAEILPRAFHLLRRVRETAEAVLRDKPDVLLTIDSPDFCLRVAQKVKAASRIRVVHYVAPTVWAWRPHRAERMARSVDQVLALLPFEPPYMERAGMSCDFVGHPVVADPQATVAEALAFRAAHGIGRAPLILALPGSRRSEVTRLIGRFGDALRIVQKAQPGTRIVLPCAAPVEGLVREMTSEWPGPPVLVMPSRDPDGAVKRAAFLAADVALAASGTVSLELAAAGTPMVIAYDANWLTRKIVSRMLLVDTVTLVNLVSGTRVVPEFIGDRCRPDLIAEGVLQVMSDPATQLAAMDLTMERLGRGGEDPGLAAARAVLARLGEEPRRS